MAENGAQGARLRAGEMRVVGEPAHRLVARGAQQPPVAQPRRHPEWRQAGLARAEEIAGTPQLEVWLGDREAISRALEYAQALEGVARHPVRHDEEAVRRRCAAPDASAELVQLGQAEALGVL